MPTEGEIDGQVPEMRPIVRSNKPGDTGPHPPQSPAVAKYDEQQTESNHHSKDRLKVFECCMSTGSGAQIQIVQGKGVVIDQQPGENKDDHAPEKEKSARLHYR